MADPRQGRASHAGYSPRLGRKDPRIRTNAVGGVTDNDLDQRTIARDGEGRQRIAALDGMKLVKPTATLSEVIAHINTIMAKLKGMS